MIKFIKKYLVAVIRIVGICIVFVALTVASLAIYNGFGGDEYSSGSLASESGSSSSCNVLGINLHGALVTYVPIQGSADDPDRYQAMYGDAVSSEHISYYIDQANADDEIKAIVIEVDSGGGYPVAGEEVAKAVEASRKPVVAIIRQSGTSAAYWAISSADKIFASRNSDVGSIGVTSSYLERTEKDTKYVQLSSGKYKDAGDPDKPLSAEEKELLLRDIKLVHENFIEDIATYRKIPITTVRLIADGSSVLGEKAKAYTLIDEIGGWAEASKYLESKIGEKPDVCWE
jgi:protease IV